MRTHRMFNEAELAKKLEEIGHALRVKLRVYLLGGCAMAFSGHKAVTKDIDAVFISPHDLLSFVQALKGSGFLEVKKLPLEYRELGASAILEDSEQFRFDVFHRKVCGGLLISDGMMGRARFFGRFGNLEVYLMSPEDIVLFKGITERPRDLDDMRMLIDSGINWRVVLAECRHQKGEKAWEGPLYNRLSELRENYGIRVPILKELMRRDRANLVEEIFLPRIREGYDTAAKLSAYFEKKYGFSKAWVLKQLAYLLRRKKVRRERMGKGYKYHVG